jgi:carbamoyl-phosphate synthase large subunit
MAEQTVTVLMTCVNAQVAPEIMTLIKDHPNYRVRLIGCDAADRGKILGRHFCEHCYSVPLGTEGGYVDAIADIVTAHDIQLIFPGSDEECLALTEHRERFERRGCRIACSGHTVVNRCFDKYRMMTYIRGKGVSTGAAYHPKSIADLDRFVSLLGYPEKEVVIKPRSGRGSRGFRVISSDYDPYETLFGSGAYRLSLDVVRDLFRSREDTLSEYYLMEMLPGDKYSADVLVSRGAIHSMVIRNNGPVPKVNPPTQDARIVFDQDIRAYAAAVIDTMPFDYFAQVEIGRTGEGCLGLIEVNTRMDATLPITMGLGLNFFREMITYAMTGRMRSDIPDYQAYPESLRFRRYWCHLFEDAQVNDGRTR